ncbi:hypothetical protein COCOBI_16-3550 [Coccomyxa sp. Obi]|nr:hypothetical protein COCOBI_16-3550 [Coccomyxa sp. Obi]
MQRPGNNPAWSGSYEIDDVDNDADRDLHVTLYDSTPEGPVAIGSGIVHLDAQTTPEVEIQLVDKNGFSVGRLMFYLDTHGYPLDRLVSKEAAREEVPAGVEVLHTEILETGEIEAPTTPPAAAAAAGAPGSPPAAATAASTEHVMVSEGEAPLVCGTRTYTVIEDRPVEKERHTTILEHHKWEKNFVIETRFIGERELTDQTKVEVISRSERVIVVARSNPCVGAPELVVDTS